MNRLHILTQKKEIPNDFLTASEKHFIGNASPHIHEFFELEYIIDGEGVCEIDGVPHPIRAGHLFLINPANTHAIRDADATLINIMFRCDYGDNAFSLPLFAPSPLFALSEKDAQLVLSMLRELVAVYSHDIRYARLLLACVLQKLSHGLDVPERTPLPYVQDALLFVTERFRDGITLESTAAHLGLSPTYLSDLFVKRTGINFKTYLDNIRFAHAKNLLAFTALPVTVISERAGFGDYANFSRRFRKRFGMTPMEYRTRQI